MVTEPRKAGAMDRVRPGNDATAPPEPLRMTTETIMACANWRPVPQILLLAGVTAALGAAPARSSIYNMTMINPILGFNGQATLTGINDNGTTTG